MIHWPTFTDYHVSCSAARSQCLKGLIMFWQKLTMFLPRLVQVVDTEFRVAKLGIELQAVVNDKTFSTELSVHLCKGECSREGDQGQGEKGKASLDNCPKMDPISKFICPRCVCSMREGDFSLSFPSRACLEVK